MNTLPKEIENYILWLSAGAMDLDIYEKKKEINEEFKFFIKLEKITLYVAENIGVYLNPLTCYDKTPELEDIEYNFGSRYLEADYGITKKQHTQWVLQQKEKYTGTF